MDLAVGGYNLKNLDRENIVLGKNGCGKSRLLKRMEQELIKRPDIGALRYISPERAGTLQYESGVDQNIANDPAWIASTRRQNQAQLFRQQSAAQFRRLELLVLREIERDPKIRNDPARTFDTVVARVNELLDRVYIERGDPSFIIKDRRTAQTVAAGEISSGESELISLGIESLVFARECVAGRLNLLLLDEPDVHLHPDLQARFGRFLNKMTLESDITLLIATHSTAFLGASGNSRSLRLAFMKSGDTDLQFTAVDDAHRRILPVFGAHPLSNVFNEAPVLLVEGEDDERLWQQAIRSADGKLSLYPVAVDSVVNLAPFEKEVAKILDAVYDNAVGYSLRDRDEAPTEIDNVGSIRRFRLNCRAAENLLLTDDVLARLKTTWEEIQALVTAWVGANDSHPHFEAMQAFAKEFDRRNADLKKIRNDLIGLVDSNKPWEVIVGQAIAAVATTKPKAVPNSLRDFLGEPVCLNLLRL